MNIFSPDSKVMIALSRLGDLIVLNFIFLLTCIPIFTIGAAFTALYTVTFKFGTDDELSILSGYFKAFRANFKQATVLWLILLLCGLCTCWDISFFYHMPGAGHFLFVPFAALFLLVLLVASYVFPLLSQFDNGNKQTLKNALIFTLAYLPRSLLITALNIFPFFIIWYSLLLFLKSGFLWVFLYFSAAAYLNALILKKVFAPYQETEEDSL